MNNCPLWTLLVTNQNHKEKRDGETARLFRKQESTETECGSSQGNGSGTSDSCARRFPQLQKNAKKVYQPMELPKHRFSLTSKFKLLSKAFLTIPIPKFSHPKIAAFSRSTTVPCGPQFYNSAETRWAVRLPIPFSQTNFWHFFDCRKKLPSCLYACTTVPCGQEQPAWLFPLRFHSVSADSHIRNTWYFLWNLFCMEKSQRPSNQLTTPSLCKIV